MFSGENRHGRMLQQAALLRGTDEIAPAARVKVILRFHGLDRPADVGGLGGDFDRAWLDDPLQEREIALDDAIARHKMWKHITTNLEIMRRELVVVMVLWERYLAADWAVANLRYKVNVRPSPPVVNARFAKEAGEAGAEGPEGGEAPADRKDAGAWMNTIKKVVETRKVLQQMNKKREMMRQSGKWGTSRGGSRQNSFNFAGGSDRSGGNDASEASSRGGGEGGSNGGGGGAAGFHSLVPAGGGGGSQPQQQRPASIPSLSSVPEADWGGGEAGDGDGRRRSIVFRGEEAGPGAPAPAAPASGGSQTLRGKSILRPHTARKYEVAEPAAGEAPERAGDAIAVAGVDVAGGVPQEEA
eukprot:tig00021043_g17609.t1